jgi:hypothetical protein
MERQDVLRGDPARALGIVDSKNLAGPELVFTRQAWAAFVAGVKAGPAAR